MSAVTHKQSLIAYHRDHMHAHTHLSDSLLLVRQMSDFITAVHYVFALNKTICVVLMFHRWALKVTFPQLVWDVRWSFHPEYFHHRKRSHPRAGPSGQGRFATALDCCHRLGKFAVAEKLPQCVSAAHHISGAWWETILRCHLTATCSTSAFRWGIKAGGVILMLRACLCSNWSTGWVRVCLYVSLMSLQNKSFVFVT